MKLAFVLAVSALAMDAQTVALQPLAQQVRRIENALDYLGQPLPAGDQKRINDAIALTDEAAAVKQIEQVLDRYALVDVDINPEGRVKADLGAASPDLVEAGTRLFLVKVDNEARVRSALT